MGSEDCAHPTALRLLQPAEQLDQVPPVLPEVGLAQTGLAARVHSGTRGRRFQTHVNVVNEARTRSPRGVQRAGGRVRPFRGPCQKVSP